MRKPDLPCSECGKLIWRTRTSLPEGQATCQPCRRRNNPAKPLKTAQTWDCDVCGMLVVSKRRGDQLASANSGRFCENHRGYAQCHVCDKWTPHANPCRKNIYCSDDCRIDAGVLRSGHYVGTSSPLPWRECVCGQWFCRPKGVRCSTNCKPPRQCPDCSAIIAKGRQRCDDCREKAEADRKRRAKANRPKGLNKHRKRAKHYGVDYEPVDRQKVYDRDGWMCGICGAPVDRNLQYPDVMSVSLDHIIPMSRGGPHSYDNTQCAHFLCNSIKSDSLELTA